MYIANFKIINVLISRNLHSAIGLTAVSLSLKFKFQISVNIGLKVYELQHSPAKFKIVPLLSSVSNTVSQSDLDKNFW